MHFSPEGKALTCGNVSRSGSGGRTRTPNDRARTCSVADYTTPERVDAHASRLVTGVWNARWGLSHGGALSLAVLGPVLGRSSLAGGHQAGHGALPAQ
jgi:hypothetical protein